MESTPRQRVRILLAEDDLAAAKLVKRLLRDGVDCDVVCVADGSAVMGTALASLPDLVLLDFAMPGRNGLEVCRALKADARTRGIPVCIVSALDRDDIVAAAFAAGAEDFIGKPVHAADLRLRVRLLLHRSSARQQIIAAASEELARARRESLQVASLIAHDLRGPLTVLVSSLAFLETSSDEADRRNLLAGCREAAKRLARTIDNMTVRAALDTPAAHVLDDVVDVSGIVSDAAKDVAALFALRELAFAIDLAPEPLLVAGDRGLLASLVTNALINAAEQSPQGMKVACRTRRVDERVEFVVEDQGPPPPAGLELLLTDGEAAAELKQRHFRIGKGLSLEVARAIAELHGGSLAVERAGEQGMRLRVRVPPYSKPGTRTRETAHRPIRLGLAITEGEKTRHTYTVGLSPTGACLDARDGLKTGQLVDVRLVDFPTARAQARVLGGEGAALEWTEWNDVFVRIVTLASSGSVGS
jgi:signal transduction histidine kinase